jgi:hypothetical protein
LSIVVISPTALYEGSSDPRIGEGKVGELQVFELSRKPRLVPDRRLGVPKLSSSIRRLPPSISRT